MLTPGEQARRQTCFHSHREPVPRVSLKCKEFFTIFIDSCSSSLLFTPKLAPSNRKSTCGQGLLLQSCGPQPLFLNRPSDPEAHLPYFPAVLKLPSMSWQVNPHLPQYFGGVWSHYRMVEDGASWFGALAHVSAPVLCKMLCPWTTWRLICKGKQTLNPGSSLSYSSRSISLYVILGKSRISSRT